MRSPLTLLRAVVAASLAGALLAGCASDSSPQRTVIVTETAADSSASSATVSGSVTAPPLTGPSETAVDSSTAAAPSSDTPSSTAEATPSVSAAPFKSIDPLKVDCARIMTGPKLVEVFGGGLPGGSNRIVEAANEERKIVGRVKCQYGVSADKTVIGVQIIFAQFQDQEASKAQIGITVSDETGRGARASTTAIQGYPADILLREGGLLVMNYDTWSMSVVVANGVKPDDQLPAALSAAADYALTQAIA